MSILSALGRGAGKKRRTRPSLRDFQDAAEGWAGGDLRSRHIGEALVDQVSARFTQHAFGLPEAPCNILITPGWQDGATLPPRAG